MASNGRPTIDDLTPLINNNLIVRLCWTMIETGNLTFQEGLIAMVLALGERNKELTDAEVDRVQKATQSFLVIDQETWEKIKQEHANA